MTDPEANHLEVPLYGLAPHEKAERAGSFGEVASHYERYRPGPPVAAVDWILPSRVGRVVDLGAGTGALTRLLIDSADEVVAVEPDDRMRAVLAEELPDIRAVAGRGESMPIPDTCVDAVLASSSWHWMDPVPALHEVGRVLVPGGVSGRAVSGWYRCRWGGRGERPRRRRAREPRPGRRPSRSVDPRDPSGCPLRPS